MAFECEGLLCVGGIAQRRKNRNGRSGSVTKLAARDLSKQSMEGRVSTALQPTRGLVHNNNCTESPRRLRWADDTGGRGDTTPLFHPYLFSPSLILACTLPTVR
jgi:hypothetical protein